MEKKMEQTAEEIETSYESDKQKIIDLIRSCAHSIMQSKLRLNEEDVVIEDLSGKEDFSHDHWVCLIMIIFEGMRTSFKVHFTSNAARILAARFHSFKIDDLTPQTSHDFMREYCNLVAGKIKIQLAGCDFEEAAVIKPMLPIQKPSYDEVELEANKSNWHCLINTDQPTSIVCSVSLEVENTSLLKNIDKLNNSVLIDDSGTVEFF